MVGHQTQTEMVGTAKISRCTDCFLRRHDPRFLGLAELGAERAREINGKC